MALHKLLINTSSQILTPHTPELLELLPPPPPPGLGTPPQID